jgi:hypothetical protein
MITSAAFIAIMLVGVPIGLCLCLAGFVYIIASGNPVLFQSYPLQLFGGVDSYGLIAIPLFILIGEIMNGGGITRRTSMAVATSVAGEAGYPTSSPTCSTPRSWDRRPRRSRSWPRSWCRRWRRRATTRRLQPD